MGLPGVVSAAPASDEGEPVDRQSVTLNLVLEEDSVLGGVVIALSRMGSHILALRKSEPSLEDVFVELVGRGFEDDGPSNGTPSTRSADPLEPTEPPEPAEVA
jgi:ABC-2 type transport system ATP-binding protein